MIRTSIIIAAGLALVAVLPAAPAQAQRDRVFVASYGSDSNPCTFGSPCKTFQQAVGVVAANGEVTAIDSAGFGPVTITKGVTITSPNGVEAGIQALSGGDAIDILAPGADVTLRGLTLNGADVGHNGIVFNSGSSLTIADCVVQYFTGSGIVIQPASGPVSFVVTNTFASNNGDGGIFYQPTGGSTAAATGVIDHVVATKNHDGITVNTISGGGATTAAISNSVSSNNTNYGILATTTSGAIGLSIDNTSVSGNAIGIEADGPPKVMLGRSVITDNTQVGVHNATTSNTLYSYQDNRINGNGTSTSDDVPTALNNSNALK
jgi:hypothetical protein